MRPILLTIAALLLALGVVEGVAYWWMHPKPAGHGEAVLVYRPSRSVGVPPLSRESGDRRQGTGDRRQEEAKAQSASPIQQSSISPSSPSTLNSQPSASSFSSPPNLQSPISNLSSLTPLPEIYAKAAPMLRCSSGQVFLAKPTDSLSLHLAFFEWDGTDTGSVLEAFRHMPEACMGSIGMILVEKAPARTFLVRGQGSRVRGQGSDVRAREETAAHGSSSVQKSTIISQQSSIYPSSPNPQSPISNHSLIFDHTVFRDPTPSATSLSPPVHAFRAVWVSGLEDADARKGLGGNEFDQLRSIRLKSALTRFKPAHARVIQGAVRGAPNGEAAWTAFEDAMLKDLSFQ